MEFWNLHDITAKDHQGERTAILAQSVGAPAEPLEMNGSHLQRKLGVKQRVRKKPKPALANCSFHRATVICICWRPKLPWSKRRFPGSLYQPPGGRRLAPGQSTKSTSGSSQVGGGTKPVALWLLEPQNKESLNMQVGLSWGICWTFISLPVGGGLVQRLILEPWPNQTYAPELF